jgi:hypothetical protein
MKKVDNDLYELLLRSIDGEKLTESESLLLKNALQNSPTLEKQRDDLITWKNVWGEASYQFQPFFVGKVMGKIEAMEKNVAPENEFSRILQSVFQKIAISSILIILFLVYSLYFRNNTLNLETEAPDLTWAEIVADEALAP